MFIQNNKIQVRSFLKEHWVLASVLLGSCLISLLSLIYISCGIFWWTAFLPIILFVAGIFYVIPKNFERSFRFSAPSVSIIVIDFFLVYSLWNTRTDAPLQSPWTHISTEFFILFFIATVLLLWTIWDKKFSAISLLATTIHTTLFYSVALITFRFGYAYDPLIHQAAENYVSLHGKITPLQPFYIGQYALVTALHAITRIPIELVDRFLLPILSSISLPIIGFVGLSRGWSIPKDKAMVGALTLLIIPLAEFTFTVPYNFSSLLLVWWILLLPYALQTRGGKFSLLALSFAATTFHPLLGIPLIAATLIAIALKKYPRPLVACIGALLIGFAIASMLGIYRMQHGETFFMNTFDFKNFINIFGYNSNMQRIAPRVQLLYGLNFLIPYVIIAAGILLRKKVEKPIQYILFSFSGGILLGIFLVSTCISIPGIVNYEQNEFVLRLKNTLPLFFLPFIFSRINEVRHKKIAIIFCAIFITISFYFSYPRADGVLKPGWNIGRSDIEVTKNIQALAKNRSYVVLSNQVLAAAGLRELGFDQRLVINDTIDTYPYPIAMSEPIYPLTQKILYQELNGTDVRTLSKLISGPVFVAVHDYWYRAAQIGEEARIAGADKTYDFDGITVYKFN